MRNLAGLFSFLVLLCGWDGGGALAAQQAPSCTSPDPFAVFGGGTCVNGNWVPPTTPTFPPTPTPTPQVISVGEQVTGTMGCELAPGVFSFTGCASPLYDLTAPSDGTLVVQLFWDPSEGSLGLWLEATGFSGASPIVGMLPVAAGQTYRLSVDVGWDAIPPVPFLLTTSISSEPIPVPPAVQCQTPKPVSNWVCVDGDWVPPDHPLALGGPSGPAPPSPAPPLAAQPCLTTQPVSNWVCINGDWIPPDHPEAISSSPAPPSPAPPPAAQPCLTIQPVSNWVCINGNWIPPDHPEAISSSPAPPAPPAPAPPPAPPTAPNCTTPDPFAGIPGLYGVCVGTSWVPVGHPLAPIAPIAVTGVQPAAGTIGKWVKIFGVGFLPDTKVTFGGTPATDIVVESGGSIFAVAPAHAAGPVDVAVRNTAGLEATLAGAYTYHPVTVTATPSVVSSGGDLIVTWVAPAGQSEWDWIGLFKMGDPNTIYVAYEYTGGIGSGSRTFVAPLQPGQYEFRYLLNDDYYDAARSSPIVVVGGSLP